MNIGKLHELVTFQLVQRARLGRGKVGTREEEWEEGNPVTLGSREEREKMVLIFLVAELPDGSRTVLDRGRTGCTVQYGGGTVLVQCSTYPPP
jgi:hypothetical protein